MAGSRLVRVTLYPHTLRKPYKLPEGQAVRMPAGFNNLTIGNLLTELARQFPQVGLSMQDVQMARVNDPAQIPLTQEEPIDVDEHIAIYLIPPVGVPTEGVGDIRARLSRTSMTKPTKKMSKRESMMQAEANEINQPNYQMYCDFRPDPTHNWPAPLPPASVLLGQGGTALEEARGHLVLGYTKCFWIIPGSVLAGPAPLDEGTLRAIMDVGVETFVDLRMNGRPRGGSHPTIPISASP